ncbi:MAG: thioredoxin [Lewinellaceae bacterium]|nr:thioredoxin [Phaeodactylibacter sp.]MCB0613346.1 thioredoxin [Phaeodactylibacter sp.]MCB9346885.1 thioredoxin [Lewinellaceae bacterium]
MSKSSFTDIINSATPVLVDFHADWCGPCKAQAPILKQLKSQMGDKIRIVKIDVDRNQPLASKLGIRSIPTLMIFQAGERKWQAMGVQNLALLKQQLESLIE